MVVGAAGLEPTTFCAQGRRSTRLSYAPTAARLTTSVDPARDRGVKAGWAFGHVGPASSPAPLPRALSVAIRGWCGELPKARVEAVEIVQIENGDDALALLARPDIAAHVRGVLPGGVYVVNPGALAALVAKLGVLGIRTTGGLSTVASGVAARSRS